MSELDVTDSEMRTRRDWRLCPSCSGLFWWPWHQCGGSAVTPGITVTRREIGTNDGVIEFVRECPGGGRGPR